MTYAHPHIYYISIQALIRNSHHHRTEVAKTEDTCSQDLRWNTKRCNNVYNEVEHVSRTYSYNKVLFEMHYNKLISKRSFGEEDLLMTKDSQTDRQKDTDDIEPD